MTDKMKEELEKLEQDDPEAIIMLYRTPDGLIHSVIHGEWNSPHEVLGVMCVFQNNIITELSEIETKSPGIN